ncbi:DUF397 domain-containing protein [Cryptosporangium aurantiacum]|uniref:DUF397 domain-containing protein n=1 Tax=Cryptosporangium aurantiacum TaxID=134849 RepID=UPI0009FC68F4
MREIGPRGDAALWQRSSHCGHTSCVEVARLGDESIALRDSKDGTRGRVLIYPARSWSAFVDAAKQGFFDVRR